MNLHHYASNGIIRSMRQVIHVLRSGNASIAARVSVIAKRLRRDQARIAGSLGRDVSGLDILIIGPGPYLVEPRFFGLKNKVTAIDLDVMPHGFSPLAYLQMWRKNGFGRFAKTIGRKVLGVDRRHARAWQQELGVQQLPEPRLIQGDIQKASPGQNSFDLVGCWAVFQSIPDPALAIRNMKASLRSGGVFYFHVHLYTSNTGHHDIRAFTGEADSLPPWAHLRSSTQGLTTPSAWLNRWRLRDWRAMLDEHAPGYQEFLETYDDAARPLLSPEVRAELAEFDEEELLTFEVFFLWKKP